MGVEPYQWTRTRRAMAQRQGLAAVAGRLGADAPQPTARSLVYPSEARSRGVKGSSPGALLTAAAAEAQAA